MTPDLLTWSVFITGAFSVSPQFAQELLLSVTGHPKDGHYVNGLTNSKL